MAAPVVSMFLLFLLPFARALITNASQGQQYNSSLSLHRSHWPWRKVQPNNRYQFLQFVLQNPKSENSATQVAESFTIHGLWPTNYKRVGVHSVDYCYFRDYTLPQWLEQELDIVWPDVNHKSNVVFRDGEYKKHGSCTNPIVGSAKDYFITAHRWYYWARDHVITPSGIRRGIRVHTGQFFMFVSQAIGGKQPLLLCHGKSGAQQIHELVICLDAKATNVIDCPVRDSWRFCNGLIYLWI